MAHYGIDEQARFRQGKRWDICEFAELKLLGSFFVACGFFAGTSCDMISHCANHAPKKRHKFPRPPVEVDVGAVAGCGMQ